MSNWHSDFIGIRCNSNEIKTVVYGVRKERREIFGRRSQNQPSKRFYDFDADN